MAFEILADPATHPDPFVRAELALDLARASGPNGMAGGQAMDLEAEKASFDLNTVTRLQAMKTGALIRFACNAGAILGQADSKARASIDRFGAIIGEAFQVADDLLDVAGDTATLGKAAHKDEAAGKATLVTALGVAGAKKRLNELVAEADAALAPFAAKAHTLRAAAHFIAERRN